MPLEIENLPEAIREVKRALRDALPNYQETFHEMEADIRRQVQEIVKDRDAGDPVIPALQYADVAAARVTPEVTGQIKTRGDSGGGVGG